MRRRWRRMPTEVRREVMRLSAQGLTIAQIMEQVDISVGGVECVLRPLGGVIRREALARPSGRLLTLEERHQIWEGIGARESLRSIGRRLGRSPSTISGEVAAGGGVEGYRPHRAHERAFETRRRPKPRKFERHLELWARVQQDLRRLWSPQQISARLRAEFGDDQTMTVSPETIYKSVYVQGRGALRKELAACLGSGSAVRRQQGRMERRGRIPEMVMISERPPRLLTGQSLATGKGIW